MRRSIIVAAVCLFAMIFALDVQRAAGQTTTDSPAAEEASFLDKIRAYLERDLNDSCQGETKTIKDVERLSDLWWPDEMCREQCKDEDSEQSLYQVGRYNYRGSTVLCCCESRPKSKEETKIEAHGQR